jgi:HD-like signal output (HDOD) protein
MAASLETWVTKIKDKPIPVLAQSIEKLNRLCANDDTSIQQIVDVVEQDPGLTVQLLRTCNSKDGGRLQREITSVQQAIMLVGTQALAGMAKKLPTLDESLQEPAKSQVLRTFCRAYHAGYQAVYWAKLRRDMTPDEVFAASQLHFLGEMILALHAPEQLLAVFEMRREKSIAYEEAQYIILGFTFDQLSLAIATAWQLPQLVQDALQAENANNPRGFGIMLAVQLARAAAIDWYSDKMASIHENVSELLDLPVDEIVKQTHQLAVKVAQHTHFYGVLQSASLLPLIKSESITQGIKQTVASDYQADICLTPQVSVLKTVLEKLKVALGNNHNVDEIIHICLTGFHDGIGLNRVVYAQPDIEKRNLSAKAVIGADNDPVFNRFSIQVNQAQLFQHLIDKTQAVCINDNNRNKYWSMVPPEFQKMIGTNSFVAMSIFVENELHGIVYADRHTSSCQIDTASYNYFKKMCSTMSDAIGISQKRH